MSAKGAATTLINTNCFLFKVICILNASILVSWCVGHEYLCTPSSQRLVGKFLVQQWINAQNEIATTTTVGSLTLKTIDVILGINSCNNGVRVFYTTKGRVLPYIAVWKCASDGISQNLKRLTYNSNSRNALLSYGLKNAVEADTAIDAMLTLWNSPPRAGRPPYFTFVREPFQRFISGFVESIHRTLHPLFDRTHPEEKLAALFGYRNVSVANERFNFSDRNTGLFQINEGIVEQMLDMVFSLQSRLILQGHFYPISGTLFSYPNIRHIGYLETFSADWDRIMEAAYGEPVAYDSKLGDHPTAQNSPRSLDNSTTQKKKDPDGSRQSLKSFLKNNMKYTRAICQILLIDYICLPKYSLPFDCQFLNQSKELAADALRRGVPIPAIPTIVH